MSEAGGSNIEIAKHLSEHEESSPPMGHEILEIVEAVVLAVVAIATAWSGYQASALDWTSVGAVRPSEQIRVKPRERPLRQSGTYVQRFERR